MRYLTVVLFLLAVAAAPAMAPGQNAAPPPVAPAPAPGTAEVLMSPSSQNDSGHYIIIKEVLRYGMATPPLAVDSIVAVSVPEALKEKWHALSGQDISKALIRHQQNLGPQIARSGTKTTRSTPSWRLVEIIDIPQNEGAGKTHDKGSPPSPIY